MNRNQKCPKCGTWNLNKNNCASCGQLLNHEMKRQEEAQVKAEEIANRAPDKIDLFLDQMKHSPWWLVKGLYYLGFSIYTIFVAIASFFMMMIAWGPG